MGRKEAPDFFLDAFTTRPDTIYGVTFLVIAPDNPELDRLFAHCLDGDISEAFRKQSHALSHRLERDRQQDTEHMQGFFTQCYARHPLCGQALPIWVGDYVLSGYGTGVVMGVPAHDGRDYMFAKRYDIAIQRVIQPSESDSAENVEGAYEKPLGRLIHSESLNGLCVDEALGAATRLLEERKVGKKERRWRLRSAVFGRQRYWGEPIPIYYKDGVPEILPHDQLPLRLPEVKDYRPTSQGESPLARVKGWHTEQGFPYETTTMPGWAGSNWYFFRYMDPKNNQAFCRKEILQYWKGVQLYVGGKEHAVGHLLYARFSTHFLFDRGYVPQKEFAQKLVNQGMIQAKACFVFRIKGKNTYVSKNLIKKYDTQRLYVNHEWVDAHERLQLDTFSSSNEERKKASFILEDGHYYCATEIEKMSKSKHNVITPEQIVHQYGADTFRLYEMFLGPIEQHKPWNLHGIAGVHRFLIKVWKWFTMQEIQQTPLDEAEKRALHKTIKKVREDTERMAFHTAISAMMIGLQALRNCHKAQAKIPFLLLLSPYAPHICEELWHKVLQKNTSITQETFPAYEAQYVKEDTFEYPVSVNGKLRAHIICALEGNEDDIQKEVLALEKLQKWIQNKPIRRFIFVKKKMINLVI